MCAGIGVDGGVVVVVAVIAVGDVAVCVVSRWC